jgi:RNA polymerase sigma-70 factor (ECF subfamily)
MARRGYSRLPPGRIYDRLRELEGERVLNAEADKPGEADLIAALRRGDEKSFVAVVEEHHSALIRLAVMYVHDRAVAEEVVQETWLGILRGLPGFEGRSSLKTWITRILLNTARTRARRESRTVPFSQTDANSDDEPAVDPDRFDPESHEWVSAPRDWETMPEQRLLSRETRAKVQEAIEALPPQQREVITLRDVEGWSAAEVCNALEVSESNQRVLLHRARSKVRRALEDYVDQRWSPE